MWKQLLDFGKRLASLVQKTQQHEEDIKYGCLPRQARRPQGQLPRSVITVLVDHNLEGQAPLLRITLEQMGWLELVSLRLATLREVTQFAGRGG